MSDAGTPARSVLEKDRVDSAAITVSGSEYEFKAPSMNLSGTKTDAAGIPKAPRSPGVEVIRPDKRKGVDLDDYFSGPMDPAKHSKLPFFMRLHGSIMPKLIIPVIFIGVWATAITCISKFRHNLSVDSTLLTVLGFVVGLSLSFRSSTAYERYAEGRKFWTQITLHSRNLARMIWIHALEREGEQEKEDVLMKLSAINLIVAYAHALKHKLRHEPYYDYRDIKPLIDYFDTYARDAHGADISVKEYNALSTPTRNWGEYLGIPFYQSNPMELVKAAAKNGVHHGNLPFEIMNYLSSYIDTAIRGGLLTAAVHQTQAFNSITMLLDATAGCERVLATPLPLAYNIAISQITWLYVLVLPFQLYGKLGWVSIPGTIVAAYIILGIAAIGREIEDPFGRDVNDLDLDRYCTQLTVDLIILTSRAPPKPSEFMARDKNMPLYPYSLSGFNCWKDRDIGQIREALKGRIDHQSKEIGLQSYWRTETFGRPSPLNSGRSTPLGLV